MEYGIRELSELAGVSARTLRYYDEIELLKPLRVSEAGYRFYGEQEVERLQQILFYRERGFGLRQIQEIISREDFDICRALEEHLKALECEREHLDALILTVRQTILSKKGELEMSDQEKFQALKERAVAENERQYGAEIREKYGEEQVEESNRKLLRLSGEEWERFQTLEAEIRSRLEEAVKNQLRPDSEEAGELVRLHREWLCMTWPSYSPEAHKGVAAMYVCDERFRKYYDREVPGCAAFLQQAVEHWAGKTDGQA